VKKVIYSAFVLKCADMCKHRFGVQLLQNPPLCSSTSPNPAHGPHQVYPASGLYSHNLSYPDINSAPSPPPHPSHAVINGSHGVTKRCLPWLTNSALVFEPKCGGRGKLQVSQPMSTSMKRSPNKLWRSNSIFNL
jgi:hypothetical protein